MPGSNVARGLAMALLAGLLGGCAMSPEQEDRQRPEAGLVTSEDSERFTTPEQEQLALMQAAGTGDIARIKTLLASGAQVNAIDAWGNSALLNAAREGEVESARILLKAGAYVDGRGGTMSPLAAAALRGHTILVRLLIRNDADVNAVGKNGLSALMNAAKLNHLGVVKVLLDAGASTRVLDRDGHNLLKVAVSENYPDMLALLLRQGVNPDLADSNGLTALYWAEYLERPELAQLLRNAGADPARKKTEIMVSQPYNFGEF